MRPSGGALPERFAARWPPRRCGRDRRPCRESGGGAGREGRRCSHPPPWRARRKWVPRVPRSAERAQAFWLGFVTPQAPPPPSPPGSLWRRESWQGRRGRGAKSCSAAAAPPGPCVSDRDAGFERSQNKSSPPSFDCVGNSLERCRNVDQRGILRRSRWLRI